MLELRRKSVTSHIETVNFIIKFDNKNKTYHNTIIYYCITKLTKNTNSIVLKLWLCITDFGVLRFELVDNNARNQNPSLWIFILKAAYKIV